MIMIIIYVYQLDIVGRTQEAKPVYIHTYINIKDLQIFHTLQYIHNDMAIPRLDAL